MTTLVLLVCLCAAPPVEPDSLGPVSDDFEAAEAFVWVRRNDAVRLMPLLGAEAYHVREAAQEQLVVLCILRGEDVKPLLQSAAKNPKREIRNRATRVLAQATCRRAHVIGARLDKLFGGPYPQLDMLWYNEKSGSFWPQTPSAQLFYDSCTPYIGREICWVTFGPDRFEPYRRATRAWLIDQVLCGDMTVESAVWVARSILMKELAREAKLKNYYYTPSGHPDPCPWLPP